MKPRIGRLSGPRLTRGLGIPGISAGEDLSAMQETQVRFLDQADPLEKG